MEKIQPLQWRCFTWDIRYKLFPFVNPQISPDFFSLRLFSFYIFYFDYKKVRVSEFTTCFTTQTEIIHNRVWPYDMFCLLHLKAKMSDIFHWLNKIINTKNKSCKYTNLLCYTGNMSTSSDCYPRRCQIFTGGFLKTSGWRHSIREIKISDCSDTIGQCLGEIPCFRHSIGPAASGRGLWDIDKVLFGVT